MLKRVSRCIFNRDRWPLICLVMSLVGVATTMAWLAIASASEIDMCVVTKNALDEASRIRGISPAAPVSCVVRSRQEIEKFLKDTITEKFPKDTLEMEQLTYRAIGLVPDDYDYVHGIVAAYVQQIGGYYDPDKKLFVMLDTVPESMQLSLAIHELTHALQDQRFNLTKFLEPTKMNNDELMARAALVEGDATAVMQDYMNSRGRKEKAGREVATRDVPVPVPAALERVLLFPYIQGLTFARRIIREGGFAGINDAFARPPSTSREILHPEQYITRAFMPQGLDVRDIEESVGVRSPLFSDTVGEFVISALLGEALSSQTRGEECAQGWRRDRIAVFKDGDTRTLSWMSEWDSEDEAREFSECYREMLKGRYQKDVQGVFVAVAPGKSMRVVREATRVSVSVKVAGT